uniref:Uncharacterized protein n=1 Tax=Glossina austeni TaxID=7395 RepID=A0A1A9UXA4_GLOAU
MYRWSSLPKDMDSYYANRCRSPYGYGRATNVYSAAPPHPKSQRQCAGLSNSLVENNANKTSLQTSRREHTAIAHDSLLSGQTANSAAETSYFELVTDNSIVDLVSSCNEDQVDICLFQIYLKIDAVLKRIAANLYQWIRRAYISCIQSSYCFTTYYAMKFDDICTDD